MRLLALALVALVLAGCTGRPPSPGESSGGEACPTLSIDPPGGVVDVGEPVEFRVLVEPCPGAAAIGQAQRCGGGPPGLTVTVLLPSGGGGTLRASEAPVPADADWPGCEDGLAPVDLPAEGFAFAWDGRFAGHCPQPPGDAACDAERPPRAGAYEVRATLDLGNASHPAAATWLLVDESTRRVPVVLVNTTFEVAGGDGAQLPGQGTGCDDFTLTREPWSATALRAGPEAAAVVVRELPESGYGAFGPLALALPAGGHVSLPSVFDPARTVAAIEDSPEGPRVAERPLADEPVELTSAYDVEWEGRTYRVVERVEARVVGEAYLFAPEHETGCG